MVGARLSVCQGEAHTGTVSENRIQTRCSGMLTIVWIARSGFDQVGEPRKTRKS